MVKHVLQAGKTVGAACGGDGCDDTLQRGKIVG